jgi:hypothetical protein
VNPLPLQYAAADPHVKDGMSEYEEWDPPQLPSLQPSAFLPPGLSSPPIASEKSCQNGMTFRGFAYHKYFCLADCGIICMQLLEQGVKLLLPSKNVYVSATGMRESPTWAMMQPGLGIGYDGTASHLSTVGSTFPNIPIALGTMEVADIAPTETLGNFGVSGNIRQHHPDLITQPNVESAQALHASLQNGNEQTNDPSLPTSQFGARYSGNAGPDLMMQNSSVPYQPAFAVAEELDYAYGAVSSQTLRGVGETPYDLLPHQEAAASASGDYDAVGTDAVIQSLESGHDLPPLPEDPPLPVRSC